MAYPNLTLYVGDGCKYCKKVLDYLDKNKLPVEIKEVWSNDDNFQELKKLTERTQVPCLKIDDAYMLESDDIVDMLKKIKSKTKLM